MQVSPELRRLCTVPGVGPVTAGAIMAFAPDLRTFDSGRNFAPWLGLVPRQRSTGGKSRLGSMSKMGQSDIRKLLVVGAMSRIRSDSPARLTISMSQQSVNYSSLTVDSSLFEAYSCRRKCEFVFGCSYVSARVSRDRSESIKKQKMLQESVKSNVVITCPLVA